MEFARSTRRVITLPLTPLIDVMFILIIFFMLTSSFMRVESLELNLPSVSPKPAGRVDVMHLFIQADGNMLLGKRKLDQQELTESLSRMFKKDPETKVMLLTAEGVTMQQLVNVMDNLYQAGGRSLFVRKWESAPAAALVKPDAPVEAPVEPQAKMQMEAPEMVQPKPTARTAGKGATKTEVLPKSQTLPKSQAVELWSPGTPITDANAAAAAAAVLAPGSGRAE